MTSHPPPPPPPRRKSPLVRELYAAKLEKDRAEERYNELADQARRVLPMGHHPDGNVEVLITPNRVWDKDKALLDYGETICSMQVDQKLAKLKLTGQAYERYYDDLAPRVVVREISPP